MGITIRIGDQERSIDAASESWIAEQLARRRQEGANICLKVSVSTGSINMVLATPGCSGSAGSGNRAPNDRERGIFDLWDARGLDKPDFNAGGVVSFLRQLARAI